MWILELKPTTCFGKVTLTWWPKTTFTSSFSSGKCSYPMWRHLLLMLLRYCVHIHENGQDGSFVPSSSLPDCEMKPTPQGHKTAVPQMVTWGELHKGHFKNAQLHRRHKHSNSRVQETLLAFMTTARGKYLYITRLFKWYVGLKWAIIKGMATLSDRWVPSQVTRCLLGCVAPAHLGSTNWPQSHLPWASQQLSMSIFHTAYGTYRRTTQRHTASGHRHVKRILNNKGAKKCWKENKQTC